MRTGGVRFWAVFDWNDLRYLAAIARSGSLTAAARELGVKHTTVGRRLEALEEALGTKLLVRGPDGVTLTDLAKEILPLVDEMAARADAIQRRVTSDDRIAGGVRVATTDTLGEFLLRELPSFHERHPELTIEILASSRSYDLLRGEADVALRVADVTSPELLVRKLGRTGWSLYASAAYVAKRGGIVDPDDLRGHDAVGFATTLRWPGALWLDERAQGIHFVLRANTMMTAVRAVAAGIGLSVLPCFLASIEPLLVRLTPRVLGSTPMMLLVPRDLARVPRVRAVLDWITGLVERDPALWSGEVADA